MSNVHYSALPSLPIVMTNTRQARYEIWIILNIRLRVHCRRRRCCSSGLEGNSTNIFTVQHVCLLPIGPLSQLKRQLTNTSTTCFNLFFFLLHGLVFQQRTIKTLARKREEKNHFKYWILKNVEKSYNLNRNKVYLCFGSYWFRVLCPTFGHYVQS